MDAEQHCRPMYSVNSCIFYSSHVLNEKRVEMQLATPLTAKCIKHGSRCSWSLWPTEWLVHKWGHTVVWQSKPREKTEQIINICVTLIP